MKVIFYSYWAWYLSATLFFIQIPMSLDAARVFTCVHHLSQVLVVLIPMSIVFIMQEDLKRVNWKFFEGCMLSFAIRSTAYMLGVYGVGDRFVIVALSGVIMFLWYIFNLDKLFHKL